MAITNGPKLTLTGLNFLIDISDKNSYIGTGNTCLDLISRLSSTLNGGVGFINENKGGLNFTSSNAYIQTTSSIFNYGSSSFTVEAVIKPANISGSHFIASKNSGSFPSWFLYLSGSNNTGKLWVEYRGSLTTSCSLSSSLQIQTGSFYTIAAVLQPSISSSTLYINGILDSTRVGNASGSLSSNSVTYIGSASPSTGSFSGSLYVYRAYNTALPSSSINTNYKATLTRF